MTANSHSETRRRAQWFRVVIIAFLAYVASSGPVIALAFKLRDITDWNGFYATMWLYYPLIWLQWIVAYINWWLDLLGTAWPG